MPEQTYRYTFVFQQGDVFEYVVRLDSEGRLLPCAQERAPAWSELGYYQCSHCPLTPPDTPYCPIARNIAEPVVLFNNINSFTPCTVTCHALHRQVTKQTVVQEGLASILGIVMATSGCPLMDFLRPLARFHLAFATVDEAIFRVAAMYLLHHFFKTDQSTPISLEQIKQHYGLVKEVNRNMLARIKNSAKSDADKNAIVSLNSLAQIFELELDSQLTSISGYFTSTSGPFTSYSPDRYPQ